MCVRIIFLFFVGVLGGVPVAQAANPEAEGAFVKTFQRKILDLGKSLDHLGIGDFKKDSEADQITSLSSQLPALIDQVKSYKKSKDMFKRDSKITLDACQAIQERIGDLTTNHSSDVAKDPEMGPILEETDKGCKWYLDKTNARLERLDTAIAEGTRKAITLNHGVLPPELAVSEPGTPQQQGSPVENSVATGTPGGSPATLSLANTSKRDPTQATSPTPKTETYGAPQVGKGTTDKVVTQTLSLGGSSNPALPGTTTKTTEGKSGLPTGSGQSAETNTVATMSLLPARENAGPEKVSGDRPVSAKREGLVSLLSKRIEFFKPVAFALSSQKGDATKLLSDQYIENFFTTDVEAVNFRVINTGSLFAIHDGFNKKTFRTLEFKGTENNPSAAEHITGAFILPATYMGDTDSFKTRDTETLKSATLLNFGFSQKQSFNCQYGRTAEELRWVKVYFENPKSQPYIARVSKEKTESIREFVIALSQALDLLSYNPNIEDIQVCDILAVGPIFAVVSNSVLNSVVNELSNPQHPLQREHPKFGHTLQKTTEYLKKLTTDSGDISFGSIYKKDIKSPCLIKPNNDYKSCDRKNLEDVILLGAQAYYMLIRIEGYLTDLNNQGVM